jgi:protein TonB
MNIQIINESKINKKVFFLALIFSVFINSLLVIGFGYFVSNTKQIPIDNKIKVKLISIKEPKKKLVKKHKKLITKKRKKRKPKTQKPKKAIGQNIAKKPSIPATVPILPETVSLDEKEITLPEKEEEFGNFPDTDVSLGKIPEYKPVLEGNFNPSFGTKLKKLDKTAFGTASGRIIVYKPPPPKIKTNLPPPPKVKVKLWVNPDGTVDKVDIVYPKAIGNLKIKQQIENYVLSWKFNAISSNEKQWAITTIRFKPVD